MTVHAEDAANLNQGLVQHVSMGILDEEKPYEEEKKSSAKKGHGSHENLSRLEPDLKQVKQESAEVNSQHARD